MITSIHTLIYSDDAQAKRTIAGACLRGHIQLYRPTHQLMYALYGNAN